MGDRRAMVALRRSLIVSAGFVLAALSACAQTSGTGGSGSTTPANDIVGGGGQMDAVYREIYHPGSGTNF